jgi:hypothetical protein
LGCEGTYLTIKILSVPEQEHSPPGALRIGWRFDASLLFPSRDRGPAHAS